MQVYGLVSWHSSTDLESESKDFICLGAHGHPLVSKSTDNPRACLERIPTHAESHNTMASLWVSAIRGSCKLKDPPSIAQKLSQLSELHLLSRRSGRSCRNKWKWLQQLDDCGQEQRPKAKAKVRATAKGKPCSSKPELSESQLSEGTVA